MGHVGVEAAAAERNLVHPFFPYFFGKLAGHRGLDETGGHGVAADAARAELLRDGAREADDAGLGRGVLWVKAQHEGALPPPCIVRLRAVDGLVIHRPPLARGGEHADDGVRLQVHHPEVAVGIVLQARGAVEVQAQVLDLPDGAVLAVVEGHESSVAVFVEACAVGAGEVVGWVVGVLHQVGGVPMVEGGILGGGESLVEVGPLAPLIVHGRSGVVDGIGGVDAAGHQEAVAHVVHAVEKVAHRAVGLDGTRGMLVGSVVLEAVAVKPVEPIAVPVESAGSVVFAGCIRHGGAGHLVRGGPVGGYLPVFGVGAGVHCIAGGYIGLLFAHEQAREGQVEVVGVADDGLGHVNGEEAETCGEVGQVAADGDARHRLVGQGALFQAGNVVDLVVEVEEVDVAALIHQDEPLGCRAVGYVGDGHVVEMFQTVVGLHAGVRGVVAEEVAVHQPIHAAAHGEVLCGYPVGATMGTVTVSPTP